MISASRAVLPPRHEDMAEHPDAAFTVPEYARRSLEELRADYLADLRAQIPSVSPGTIKKYDDTLGRFFACLARHGQPLTLRALTERNVNDWTAEQKAAGLSEHTIVNRLAALKAFSSKYLWKEQGYTHYDLLGRVRKRMPPEAPRRGLTESEREAILNCLSDPTYTDTRDRAFVALAMATGLRFAEVLELPLANFDHARGRLVVRGKGGKVREAQLGARPLRLIRQYLAVRPPSESDRLWLTSWGAPLTYEGGHCIIRRVRERSGVARLHWHLFRHGFAQTALTKGADPLIVQEMLGHSSATMTRKYLGQVRQTEAARLMPQFAPI